MHECKITSPLYKYCIQTKFIEINVILLQNVTHKYLSVGVTLWTPDDNYNPF